MLGTTAAAINDAGDVVGSYVDTMAIFHGFIRSP